MDKMPGQTAKYNFEDLVKFVQDFHLQHHRVPTCGDIKLLSKKGKSPSHRVFYDHGGLNWVIENAKLKPPNKSISWHGRNEVLRVFKNYIKTFISQNGCPPRFADIEHAAKSGDLPYPLTIKRNTGKTVSELMYELGFTGNRLHVQKRRNTNFESLE
jgi:hypothetical protein